MGAFMFHVCATLCSTSISRSNLFDTKSIIGVEMLYKVLDRIGKPTQKSRKKRKLIIQRLHFLLYNSDCDDKLIEQISQGIYILRNPYHWYQLIVWNNFFHGIFSFGDPGRWSNTSSGIGFVSNINRKHNHPIIGGDNVSSSQFDKELDVSAISLLHVDYLIKSRLKIDQRNYPLENKVIELLQQHSKYVYQKYSLRLAQMNQRHPHGQESELFTMQQELNSKDEDLFDKLCNVLSVFGKNCGDVIIAHSDIIDQFIRKQKIPFDAVFDLFERLKIYDIYVARRQNKNKKKQSSVSDARNEIKEQEDEMTKKNVGHAGDIAGITSFFLEYFAQYVESIQDEESKTKLHKLLTKYKLFIDGSSKKAAVENFYSKVAANRQILYGPAFVPCIKHIFEEYSDDEMNEWYLHYWDMHGIKGVVDIIYKCRFKFDIFCSLLKQYPQRLQNDTICKFEEWLELIVQPSKNIPNATKLIIAKNGPLKFDDIMNIKSEKERNDCLERLKLVLVKDDATGARLLEFGRKLEMPLAKYKNNSISNAMLRYLLEDTIPNLNSQGVYQDKRIISFFVGNVGQEMIRFINQLIRIVETDQNENPFRVVLPVLSFFFRICVLRFLVFSILTLNTVPHTAPNDRRVMRCSIHLRNDYHFTHIGRIFG